jgi:hypothetical protein
MPCRIARTASWKLRLLHELDSWTDSMFLTLTYNDENMPLGATLVKSDLQKFFKRVRKSLGDDKIKYFACGEYGDETFRPHYHAIIFGYWPKDAYGWRMQKAIAYFRSDSLEKLWPFGNSEFGFVNGKSCAYVAGYIEKKIYGNLADEVYGDRQPPFQVQSRGLGLDFALQHKEQFEYQLTTTIDGHKVCLPKYYIEKLDIDKERLKAIAVDNERKKFKKASKLLQQKGLYYRQVEYLGLKFMDLHRRECDLEAKNKDARGRKKI